MRPRGQPTAARAKSNAGPPGRAVAAVGSSQREPGERGRAPGADRTPEAISRRARNRPTISFILRPPARSYFYSFSSSVSPTRPRRFLVWRGIKPVDATLPQGGQRPVGPVALVLGWTERCVRGAFEGRFSSRVAPQARRWAVAPAASPASTSASLPLPARPGPGQVAQGRLLVLSGRASAAQGQSAQHLNALCA